MELSKEIIILTPIGRIKWPQAPDTIEEIIYHLSRTFNAPELCITLIDTNYSTEVTQEIYRGLIIGSLDIILSVNIDYTLKGVLESAKAPEEIKSDLRAEAVSYEDRKVGGGKTAQLIEAYERKDRDEGWSSKAANAGDLWGGDEVNSADVSWRAKPQEETVKAPVKSQASISRGGRSVRGKGSAKVLSEEEQKIQEGMKTLRDFGFTDSSKCRAALIKAKMNIEEAIDALISGG